MKLAMTIAALTAGIVGAAVVSGPGLAQGSDTKPAARVAGALPQGPVASRAQASQRSNAPAGAATQKQALPDRVAAPRK